MAKKSIIYMLFFSLVFNQGVVAQEKSEQVIAGEGFLNVGENFGVQNILGAYQMQEIYADLKPGDTLEVTFQGAVTSICKNKGCWMEMDLEDGREVMVKFKDYAFFVPPDINRGMAIVYGKAYVEEMSVEQQRHFAGDEGKTPEEISTIVNTQKTLSIMAEGVKIKKTF